MCPVIMAWVHVLQRPVPICFGHPAKEAVLSARHRASCEANTVCTGVRVRVKAGRCEVQGPSQWRLRLLMWDQRVQPEASIKTYQNLEVSLTYMRSEASASP